MEVEGGTGWDGPLTGSVTNDLTHVSPPSNGLEKRGYFKPILLVESLNLPLLIHVPGGFPVRHPSLRRPPSSKTADRVEKRGVSELPRRRKNLSAQTVVLEPGFRTWDSTTGRVPTCRPLQT